MHETIELKYVIQLYHTELYSTSLFAQNMYYAYY